MENFDRQFISLLWVMFFSLAGGAFAFADDSMKGTASTDTEVHQHISDRSAVISFNKGKYNLSAADQVRLQNLINKIGTANLDRVEVAVWSDKTFPKTSRDLPKSDCDLADNRSDAIRDYLKDKLGVSSVKTFNMAETSNWLAKTFMTDEAELKSEFSKDAGAPMAREDFNLIEREGAPSKAVVIAVHKSNWKTANPTDTNPSAY